LLVSLPADQAWISATSVSMVSPTSATPAWTTPTPHPTKEKKKAQAAPSPLKALLAKKEKPTKKKAIPLNPLPLHLAQTFPQEGKPNCHLVTVAIPDASAAHVIRQGGKALNRSTTFLAPRSWPTLWSKAHVMSATSLFGALMNKSVTPLWCWRSGLCTSGSTPLSQRRKWSQPLTSSRLPSPRPGLRLLVFPTEGLQQAMPPPPPHLYNQLSCCILLHVTIGLPWFLEPPPMESRPHCPGCCILRLAHPPSLWPLPLPSSMPFTPTIAMGLPFPSSSSTPGASPMHIDAASIHA